MAVIHDSHKMQNASSVFPMVHASSVDPFVNMNINSYQSTMSGPKVNKAFIETLGSIAALCFFSWLVTASLFGPSSLFRQSERHKPFME